jgi:small subunit ribosomal protein S1
MNHRPKSSFTRSHEADDAIDAAMDEALKSRTRAESDLPLKKQWDDELEAELNEAMEGFDASTIDVGRPGRTRAADRSHVPKGQVGQEERSGLQKAKVIAIRGQDVFLDLGAKSEGVVPLSQFDDKPPAVGDVIDVVFDRFDKDEGLLVMSVKGAAVQATWANLRKDLIVEARVVKEIKGGLEVEVNGIRGFLPMGQVELGRIEETKPYINQKLRVLVTEADQRQRNLVVSRRELLQREREEQREKTWASLEEGQVRKGIVRSVRDFGAFVDLGGVDGLVHVSDLSWSRDKKPGDLLKLGDEVEVKVLKIDRVAQKVGLGLKQLAPSPWDDIEDRYERGQTIKGKVTRLMDFGAFVEIEPGIEGLIHVSELANRKVYRVKDYVQPGQEVEVRLLDIDPEAKRIALSMKPLPVAPAPEPDQEDDDAPSAPKPERKVPLKGGLGDRDANPFGRPPRGPNGP